MRQQGAVVPNFHVSINHRVSADGSIFPNVGRGMNYGRWVNDALILERPVEQLSRTQIGILWISGAQRGLIQSREIFFDDDGRSVCAAGRGRIFGVGDKSNLTGSSGINGGNAGYFRVGLGRFQPET